MSFPELRISPEETVTSLPSDSLSAAQRSSRFLFRREEARWSRLRVRQLICSIRNVVALSAALSGISGS